MRSRVIIATPSLALKLQAKNSFDQMQCLNVVLDKVDLLQALEFGSDLAQLKFDYSYRCLMTSSDMRADQDKTAEEIEEFKSIKSHFMGDKKALVIKLNLKDERDLTLIERIQHLYCYTESQLDKFMLIFACVKLAII